MAQSRIKKVSQDGFINAWKFCNYPHPQRRTRSSADVAASLPEYEVVLESIHDGDTLRVRCGTSEILKIRFACVDALELKQPLGQESRNYLRSTIDEAGGKVKVQIVDTDRYGRSVAELWAKSGLVQSRMTAAGMAFGYDR